MHMRSSNLQSLPQRSQPEAIDSFPILLLGTTNGGSIWSRKPHFNLHRFRSCPVRLPQAGAGSAQDCVPLALDGGRPSKASARCCSKNHCRYAWVLKTEFT
jgi:hypothetical protein